ncbi:MAG TPA: class I SAM-dependent methyltransferase [Herpetosiphonaceae bacterium]
MDQQAQREQNRRSWNAVVPAHESHHMDQAAFFRDGGSTLFAEERALLGDVAGRTLAHLMCNTGQDALSLARLGAIVTGVDLSDSAIASARELSAATEIPATFVRADVYEWLRETAAGAQRFDIVYCAYGVICWLDDLQSWARGIAAVLNPGGRFVLVEFHPASNMFDRDWRLAADYPARGRLLALPGIGDYVGASEGGLTPSGYAEGMQDFVNPEPCYLHQWGLGEVVTALAEAGLMITALHEYPYVNGERPFAEMRADADRRMYPPDDVPALPLMYGLAARKPEETHGN